MVYTTSIHTFTQHKNKPKIMKSKYLKGIFLLSIITLLMISKARQTQEVTTQLLLDNVEALAHDESYAKQTCLGNGNVKCSFNGTNAQYVITYHNLE